MPTRLARLGRIRRRSRTAARSRWTMHDDYSTRIARCPGRMSTFRQVGSLLAAGVGASGPTRGPRAVRRDLSPALHSLAIYAWRWSRAFDPRRRAGYLGNVCFFNQERDACSAYRREAGGPTIEPHEGWGNEDSHPQEPSRRARP
jgi:hypothetical protein